MTLTYRAPLTALVALIWTAIPVAAAQEFTISRSIALEARRLASAPEPARTTGRPQDDWAQIARLRPGVEIALVVDGRPELQRGRLLRADADQIVVLNAATIGAGGAQRLLVDFASQSPAAIAKTNSVTTIGVVRVAPDGVFVRGRKVAEHDDVVMTIPRPAVAQITRQHANLAHKTLAAIGGAVGGFDGGGLVGAAVQPACGCDDPGLLGAVIGAPIGAALGGIFAPRLVKPQTDVIYRRR